MAAVILGITLLIATVVLATYASMGMSWVYFEALGARTAATRHAVLRETPQAAGPEVAPPPERALIDLAPVVGVRWTPPSTHSVV